MTIDEQLYQYKKICTDAQAEFARYIAVIDFILRIESAKNQKVVNDMGREIHSQIRDIAREFGPDDE